MAKTALARMPSLRRAATMAAVALALVFSAVLSVSAAAQEQSLPGGFAPDQVQGIEQIVRDDLIQHPEVLIQSLTAHQENQRVAQEQRRQQSVIDSRAALTQDPDTPVIGKPGADVTIVEFFDYRCQYCRRVVKSLRQLMEQDDKIRLVMKEFPILGPQSIQAARAALASVGQGKYEEFHWALMTEPGDMSDPHIRQIARTVGLDVERLQKDMQSPDIDAMIRRNHELARALDINGTPAFVIGNALVPGAVDLPTLKRLVAQARAKQS